MQELTREALVAKASELFEKGVVDRMLGWKKGEFSYDDLPAYPPSWTDEQRLHLG